MSNRDLELLKEIGNSGAWWKDDEIAQAVDEWLAGHEGSVRIARSQWQGLLRSVRDAGDFEGFLETAKKHLDGRAERDKQGRGWNREGIRESLLAEMRRVGIGGEGSEGFEEIRREWRRRATQVPEAKRAAEIGRMEDARRLARARHFLRLTWMALVCRWGEEEDTA